MMPLAVLAAISVTEPVANWAINVIGDLGLWGIFLLMAPESACIPIPSEPTMLFAGFNTLDRPGHPAEYSIFAASMVATVANLVGSWVAYAAGYYGRHSFMLQNRFFHINEAQLDRAHVWFERYGGYAVFFSRMMPIVRTFISLPAGIARMNIWSFSILTFLGAFPWNFGLVWLGNKAAEDWEDWRDRLHYVDYAFALAIVAIAVYLYVRWRRGRRADAPAQD
jgi:membrane protein DedA with SNARE-associated domain